MSQPVTLSVSTVFGPIYSEEDEEGKQYERQQVIVKFKNWGSRTKVYKNRKKIE